jgi:hypothetical protein
MNHDLEIPVVAKHTVFLPPRRNHPVELADIVKRYLPAYLQSHNLSLQQQDILNNILNCRTANMGLHLRSCDNENCDYHQLSYNSCGSRYCPKCQEAMRVQWVNQRLSELLPIPYYHVVFTMPHELNNLCLCNKAVIYDIFFQTTAETLKTFAKDKRFLGGDIGFISVLHTWGQMLNQHVHLHVIVPGGGLSEDRKRWKALPYRKEFLFPGKAMAMRLRKRFSEELIKAYDNGELQFPGELGEISSKKAFISFVKLIGQAAWKNHVKKPFADAEKALSRLGNYIHEPMISGSRLLDTDSERKLLTNETGEVIGYLGNYTNKTAISNSRLMDMDDGQVRFHYRDYQDDGKPKVLSLSGSEFLRRFLLHTLPKGFKRIRYYGILACGCRKECLDIAG